MLEDLTPGLLERERELGMVSEALEDAERGQGRLVLVSGDAGTGKSALVAESVALARERGTDVLRARGGEMERDQPNGLLGQLLEPTLAALDPAARRELLCGAAAPVGQALGLDGEASAAADGFAVAHAVYWLLAGLAAGGPLLVAVDDAHWGDISSLTALEHLARRIEDLGITLLISLRPAEPDAPAALLDALGQAPGAAHLTPRPLSPAAVTAVLTRRWSEVGDDLAEACHAATGGNPLLLAELVRALPGAEPPTVAAVRAATVPTLEQRVLRRAQRAAPGAAGFAQIVAVLGDGARLGVAAALAELELEAAARLAHRLRRIEVLAGEDPLVFVHPLVRRSLYDGIPLGERQALHARAAEVLTRSGAPAELAVAHLGVLTPAGSVTVARAHLAAAESALARAAPAEAARWLERALAEAAPQPPRAELLARLGLTQVILRDPSAVAVLSEAYDTLTDPDLRRSVAVELGYMLAVSGAWERATALR